MATFLQASSVVLLSVVLIMSLYGQGRDIGLLLSIFVCCVLGCLAVTYLTPVFQFVDRLQAIGSLNDEILRILLKVVGIAFLSELVALACADSGNGSMGKALQFLAVAIILYLSLPVFQTMLELIESILENL